MTTAPHTESPALSETSPPSELPPELLMHRCEPESLPFETTADLEEMNDIVGQPRAVEAVKFGIGLRRRGYNLFALGPLGIGKQSVITHYLERSAASEPSPSDWCYVNNFEESQKPRALQLPAGSGHALRLDVEKVLEDLFIAVRAAFESDDYRARKEYIESSVKRRQESAIEELKKRADEEQVAVVQTPGGIAFLPTRGGELVNKDDFHKLAEEERHRIDRAVNGLQEQLSTMLRAAPQWEREAREKVRMLNREVMTNTVSHPVSELRARYDGMPQVVGYLEEMERDLIDNATALVSSPDPDLGAALVTTDPQHFRGSPLFRRYTVNVIVDRRQDGGAPVVYEDFPTYANLLGRVEYVAQLGNLVTDFNFVRAGALHRANGGYLVLEAQPLLSQPYAWEGLKRALRSSEIRVQSAGQMMGMATSATLDPEPIPLDVKVVLLGDRKLYYLLAEFDPEFRELFKVQADFEETMPRTPENVLLYARLIGSLARKEDYLHFDRSAVARIIEHSARVAENASKLSMHMMTVTDLLKEADYWARLEHAGAITASHVQRALDAQIERADRLRDRLIEETVSGTYLLDTEGAVTGQVNGLSVMRLGQLSFGHPTRITATIGLGSGDVLDIERAVRTGGPLHSKGVLILSGYLTARFASQHPLSLTARLVFEQSYGMIDGDSASSAELYALLSAISGFPIRQSFAVTGSVNQRGDIQSIGGVNEKIEGFFDLCKAKGLTGEQGVLIPAANVQHLMLRADVVDAVRRKEFHVHAVTTVDQGIEILTGRPAAEVNRQVCERLKELARKRLEYSLPLAPVLPSAD